MKSVTTLNERFYQSHVTFTSVPAITEITQPLNQLGLSYFTFDRTYHNGEHLRLTNAGKWIENYYRTDLYKAAIFEKDPRLFFNGCVFWSWLNREPIYSAAAEHNIDHGLTIIEKHDTYADFFHFGTTHDNYIAPELLVTKLDYLYRFIAYFKQKANPIVVEAEKTRFKLLVPQAKQITLNDLNDTLIQTQDDHDLLHKLFKKTEVTRLYLGSEFNNSYLTRREMDVLRLMKDGQKPVEIAKSMGLSVRTLETHLKNIKAKLKCKTLFELGFALGTLGLKNHYPFKVEVS